MHIYMTKAEIAARAHEMFKTYGLEDWNIKFRKAKSYIGLCRYRDKTITISTVYAPAMIAEQIENALKHEIAHALVGWGHGHNEVWQAKAIEIGAEPKTTANLSDNEGYDLSRIYDQEIMDKFNGKKQKKERKVTTRKPRENAVDTRALDILTRLRDTYGDDLTGLYAAFYAEMKGTCEHRQIQLLFKKWFVNLK